VLFAALVLVVACRALDLTVTDYVKYVVPRAALGALPIVALLLWFRLGLHVQSFPGLMAAGSVMVLLFGITWIFFVYRRDPYVDLRPHLGRLRRGTRRVSTRWGEKPRDDSRMAARLDCSPMPMVRVGRRARGR
jgi:hypothetical protein